MLDSKIKAKTRYSAHRFAKRAYLIDPTTFPEIQAKAYAMQNVPDTVDEFMFKAKCRFAEYATDSTAEKLLIRRAKDYGSNLRGERKDFNVTNAESRAKRYGYKDKNKDTFIKVAEEANKIIKAKKPRYYIKNFEKHIEAIAYQNDDEAVPKANEDHQMGDQVMSEKAKSYAHSLANHGLELREETARAYAIRHQIHNRFDEFMNILESVYKERCEIVGRKKLILQRAHYIVGHKLAKDNLNKPFPTDFILDQLRNIRMYDNTPLNEEELAFACSEAEEFFKFRKAKADKKVITSPAPATPASERMQINSLLSPSQVTFDFEFDFPSPGDKRAVDIERSDAIEAPAKRPKP